jgi:APA family basic amino acid/polyamine antiporter
VDRWLLARDLCIAAAGTLFSMWVTFAAGYSAVYQAMVIVLIGIILYAIGNGRRPPEAAAEVIPAGTTGPEA